MKSEPVLWRRMDNDIKVKLKSSEIGINEVFSHTLDLCTNKGGFVSMDIVWDLVEHIENLGFQPTSMTASYLLKIATIMAAAGNATVADGDKVLDWARSAGIKPSIVLYSIQLDLIANAAVCHMAGAEQGFALLDQMAADGTQPNIITFTLLLHLISNAIDAGRGSPADIDRALTAMRLAGVEPNLRSRTALLSAYAQAAKFGFDCLEQARTVVSSAFPSAELTSTITAEANGGPAALHNALLDVCAKASEFGPAGWLAARAAMHDMHARGVARETVSYFCLLEAGKWAAARGEVGPQDAWDILADMDRDGLIPTELCYAALLAWHAKAAAAAAAEAKIAAAAATRRGTPPPPDPALGGRWKFPLVGSEALEAARSVRFEMQRRGVPCTAVIYAAEMEVLAKLSLRGVVGMPEGQALIREMRAALPPRGDPALAGGGSTGEGGAAGPAADERVPPPAPQGPASTAYWAADASAAELAVYNALLGVVSGAASRRRAGPEDALGVVRWMEEQGTRPDVVTFNAVIKVCLTAAKQGNARLRHGEEVLRWMAERGIAPDPHTMGAMMALAREDGSPDALEEGWKMFQRLTQPFKTQRLYFAAMLLLQRANRLPEARGLLDQAVNSGVAPNRFMFNAAMNSCDTPQQVLELKRRMDAAGVVGDVVTARLAERAASGFWSPLRPRRPVANDPMRRSPAPSTL